MCLPVGGLGVQLSSDYLPHGKAPCAAGLMAQGVLNSNFPAGAWGDLKGVQCACLVEVVEHLDPEPLRALGPCVLGALQPAMLVVTTPNREYNPLLHTLGSALLPNKLRNTDHLFEW